VIPKKDQKGLDAMRVSCRAAARVRDAVAKAIAPGMSTGEIADLAGTLIIREGGTCAFLGYQGFPGKICVSVNDEVVHGIPSASRQVQMGDIVSLDIGVLINGYYGDTATTVMVGVTDSEVIRLVRTTERALEAALAQVGPGVKLGTVSHAVEKVVSAAGFGVVRDFVGHGIGTQLHEEPQIPNFGRVGKGPTLRPGMTLAIEPMVNMGTADVEVQSDGWTVLTADRRLSAHEEHTIAVTEDGVEILTRDS
jgi:methionyl aminopeptidase